MIKTLNLNHLVQMQKKIKFSSNKSGITGGQVHDHLSERLVYPD